MRRAWDFSAPLLRWIGLAIVVFFVIYLLITIFGIQPPHEFTIATGQEGGAYHTFAKQYQKRFGEEGYTLHIRPTSGSHETIDLLNSGEVDAGFIQNTAYEDRDISQLSTLASLYYEPLWIFYDQDLLETPHKIADLEGLRINIGEIGSGTFVGSTAVLDANGISEENSTIIIAPSGQAAEMLKSGEIDVMMVIAGAESSFIQGLLKTPGIELMPEPRTTAYTSHIKTLSSVVLGEGVIDLDRNIPAEDKQLLATRATLVANDDLHPDLARLLLVIAGDVHTPGGILEDPGEFPAPIFIGIPMNKDALRYLERGSTGLDSFLPLWMASRLERVFFLLIPIVLVLYPLLRGAPSGVRYMYRYRLKRRYQYLREVEIRFKTLDLDEVNAAIAELETYQNDLDENAPVPASMLPEYYSLRVHTNHTLDRLRVRRTRLEADNHPTT